MASPPRRRLSPAERREQLLDAALASAAGGDIAAISVEELAGRAGVSEGLLYHYFPNKEALVVAAVRRAADSFIADLRAATAEGGLIERLVAGLAAYLDHVQAQPTGWRALLQAHSGELGVIVADVEANSLALTLEALGIAEPSPTLLVALAGWSALERDTCLRWLDHPEIPRATIEDLLMTGFISALTAAGRHDPRAGEALERLSGAG